MSIIIIINIYILIGWERTDVKSFHVLSSLINQSIVKKSYCFAAQKGMIPFTRQ